MMLEMLGSILCTLFVERLQNLLWIRSRNTCHSFTCHNLDIHTGNQSTLNIYIYLSKMLFRLFSTSPTQKCSSILHWPSVSNPSAVVWCKNSSCTSSDTWFKKLTITEICSFLLSSLLSSTKAAKCSASPPPHRLFLLISHQPLQ